MTLKEQAELAEIGMDETALRERQAQVSAMLARHEPQPETQEQAEARWIAGASANDVRIENGRKRRVRSDAGVAKGPRAVKQMPTAPSPAGSISPQQAAQLIRLAEIMRGAAQRLAEAQRVAEWATADYQRYVESLTVNS